MKYLSKPEELILRNILKKFINTENNTINIQIVNAFIIFIPVFNISNKVDEREKE